MEINFYAGRSFNDPSQYPIFPWILKDYHTKTETFDLKNHAIYRNLDLPMGALNETRLNFFKMRKDSLDEV